MADKKQLKLSPDAFQVNEKGEVIIKNDKLAEALKSSVEESSVGEQGVVISVSVSI